jgi:hypothetical protein
LRPRASDPHPAKGNVRSGTTPRCCLRQYVDETLLASHRTFRPQPRSGADVPWPLRRPALTREERNSSRSPSARDGHQFESPQLHQEVRANSPGFPAPTISRLFSALARRLMFCGLGARLQVKKMARYAALADEHDKPWWGRLVGRIQTRRGRTARKRLRERL